MHVDETGSGCFVLVRLLLLLFALSDRSAVPSAVSKTRQLWASTKPERAHANGL